MNSSESAEEIVKLTLEGMEVVAKIAGQGAERVAIALYAMAKGNTKTKGKTSLNQMLKSGGQLQIFSLKQEDMKKFHEVAKKYGVLYTALVDKKHKDNDGLIDIIVRAEDAPRINRIVERFNLATVDIETIKEDIENDKIEGIIKDANDKGVEGKSDEERIVEEIFSKPVQKETNEMENPEVAKTEDAHPSEPLSENKKESGAASNNKKLSVKKLLQEIKEEIKYRNAPKIIKEKLKEGQPITVIDAPKHKITTYTPRNKKSKTRKER